VSDHRRVLDAGRLEGLPDVLEVLRERPGRLPARAAVAAQVRRKHAVAPREPFFGEAAEPTAVGHDPVEAEDGRGVGIAPRVEVQQHAA
jgi:hypothetical protein